MYDVGCHSRDDKVTDSVDGHRGKGCQEDCDASQCHMKVFVVHCKKMRTSMLISIQGCKHSLGLSHLVLGWGMLKTK